MENTEKKEVKKYTIKVFQAERAYSLFNRAIVGGLEGEVIAKIRIVRSKLKGIVLDYFSNRDAMIKEDFGFIADDNNQFPPSTHPKINEINKAVWLLYNKEVELPELKLIEGCMSLKDISAFTIGMNGEEFSVFDEVLKMIKI